MAEVFGRSGEAVPISGMYECAECGHREHFVKGTTFPSNHHPEKPWILYVRDDNDSQAE